MIYYTNYVSFAIKGNPNKISTVAEAEDSAKRNSRTVIKKFSFAIRFKSYIGCLSYYSRIIF